MKSLEQLKEEFKALEASYRANPLPAGKAYNEFAKKWKRLKSQIKNYNSGANVMKRAGLKSTKTSIGYRIEYKGIFADVYLDGCETEYWSIDIIEGDLDLYYVQHDTKGAAIWFLFVEINEANGLPNPPVNMVY